MVSPGKGNSKDRQVVSDAQPQAFEAPRRPDSSLDDLGTPAASQTAGSHVVIDGTGATSALKANSAQQLTSTKPVVHTATRVESAHTDRDTSTLGEALARSISTLKALGTSIGSSICYSLTGVCNQAAKGAAADVAQYPNPFLYSGLRSAVATIVSYLKDRETLQKDGLKSSFNKIGSEGKAMCLLMGLNNVLWVPAFMLTDLASAIVIACSQPFVHAIYDRVKTKRPHSLPEMASLGLAAAALSSIAISSVKASSAYPYAVWGNLSAVAAVLCFCTYMIMNNNVVQRAALQAGPNTKAQEDAKQAAQERLRTVPFFSQLASTALGFGLFLPFSSGALLSGGLGLSVTNTFTMAVLHGAFTAAALHLRTVATQTNKPLLVSLIANFQVGLTPALGWLLLGSTVPEFAILGGIFSVSSSMVAVAGEYIKQKPKKQLTPDGDT